MSVTKVLTVHKIHCAKSFVRIDYYFPKILSLECFVLVLFFWSFIVMICYFTWFLSFLEVYRISVTCSTLWEFYFECIHMFVSLWTYIYFIFSPSNTDVIIFLFFHKSTIKLKIFIVYLLVPSLFHSFLLSPDDLLLFHTYKIQGDS